MKGRHPRLDDEKPREGSREGWKWRASRDPISIARYINDGYRAERKRERSHAFFELNLYLRISKVCLRNTGVKNII